MKKIISVLMVVIILISITAFSGCGWHPPRPQYASQYTEEEQVYRITCEAKHRYEDVLNSGDMLTFSVHILYTFDEFPEYFLIEHTWKNYSAYLNYLKDCGYNVYELENVDLNAEYYSHIIGCVKEDCYYIGIGYYNYERNGKSYYTKSGAIEEGSRLYFASYYTYAYVKGGNLIGCKFSEDYTRILFLGEEWLITSEEREMLIKEDRKCVYRRCDLLISKICE